MICYCNKTKIYCLEWFPTVSLKSSVIIARIPSQEKKSIYLKYIVNKRNKQKPYLMESQTIYNRTITANIYGRQVFTPQQN